MNKRKIRFFKSCTCTHLLDTIFAVAWPSNVFFSRFRWCNKYKNGSPCSIVDLYIPDPGGSSCFESSAISKTKKNEVLWQKKDQRLNFSWNFSHWKTAFGGFSPPDLEREIKIDGSTPYLQLRKEKFGGMITLKFANFTTKNYYSMSLDQLTELREALDELGKKARKSEA